jgi:hypothetical protein
MTSAVSGPIPEIKSRTSLRLGVSIEYKEGKKRED